MWLSQFDRIILSLSPIAFSGEEYIISFFEFGKNMLDGRSNNAKISTGEYLNEYLLTGNNKMYLFGQSTLENIPTISVKIFDNAKNNIQTLRISPSIDDKENNGIYASTPLLLSIKDL